MKCNSLSVIDSWGAIIILVGMSEAILYFDTVHVLVHRTSKAVALLLCLLL